MNFQGIIGQETAVEILRKDLDQDRVAHAYLFTGPQGVGKGMAARAMAQALLCQTGDSCHRCAGCHLFGINEHPDFFWLEPAGASLKIEQIRRLNKEVSTRPYMAARRVIVINQAETMTAEAANSLLKTLEEPPAYVVFFLIASNLEKMLPTVLSRCRLVRFAPLSPRQVEEYLYSRLGYNVEKARLAAAICEGRLGLAVEWVENGLFEEAYDCFSQVIRSLCAGDILSLLEIAGNISRRDELLPLILDLLTHYFRSVSLALQEGELQGHLFPGQPDADAWDLKDPRKLFNVLLQARNDADGVINTRLALEVAFLQAKEVVQCKP